MTEIILKPLQFSWRRVDDLDGRPTMLCEAGDYACKVQPAMVGGYDAWAGTECSGAFPSIGAAQEWVHTTVAAKIFGRLEEARKTLALYAQEPVPHATSGYMQAPTEPSPIKSPHSDGVFKKPDAQPAIRSIGENVFLDAADEMRRAGDFAKSTAQNKPAERTELIAAVENIGACLWAVVQDQPVAADMYERIKLAREQIRSIRAALEAEPIAWSADLEQARLDLCNFWTGICYDPQRTDATGYGEIRKRALETEQALTILGEIARRKPVDESLIDVGQALIDTISRNVSHWALKGWGPTNCPSEIVCDLLNLLDEVKSAAYPDPIALKFAQQHGWAQPGDFPHRTFVLQFDDEIMGNMVWTGEDASTQALDAWRQYAPSWSCTLFMAVRTVKP